MPGEAETMINSLKYVDYEEYGLERWFSYHGYITKLNLQAISSVKENGDEFVKEYLITYKKLPMLVKDLIMVEFWREQILSRWLNGAGEQGSTFTIYSILYHELLLVNLLETVTFYADATESLSDTAVDLVDWSYRALCQLVIDLPTESSKTEFLTLKNEIPSESITEDIKRQHRLLSFEKAMKAVSVVHHLLDQCLSSRDVLPLGVARRLLHTNDIVLVLCQLLDQSPWQASAVDSHTGRKSYFVWQENGVWKSLDETTSRLGKTEGQIWLCLYQILLGNQSSLHYDCTLSHRRAALLKLRSHLTDTLMDALPVLIDLRRYLEQLSVTGGTVGRGQSNSGSGATDFCLVELVPELREEVSRRYAKSWDKVYQAFCTQLNSDRGRQAAQRAAMAWTDTFTEERLQELVADGSPPRCVVCGELAAKRCSRCQSEFYCRRECQVKHWQKHKPACDLMARAKAAEDITQ